MDRVRGGTLCLASWVALNCESGDTAVCYGEIGKGGERGQDDLVLPSSCVQQRLYVFFWCSEEWFAESLYWSKVSRFISVKVRTS